MNTPDNVVDLNAFKPHVVCELICVRCVKRWISVRPVGTLLKNMECPHCLAIGGVIMTGQPLEEGKDHV